MASRLMSKVHAGTRVPGKRSAKARSHGEALTMQ